MENSKTSAIRTSSKQQSQYENENSTNTAQINDQSSKNDTNKVVDEPHINVKDKLVGAEKTENVNEECTEDDGKKKEDDDYVYPDPPVNPQPVSQKTETEARVADAANDIDRDEKEKHYLYAKSSNLRERLDSKEHELWKKIKELEEENDQLRLRFALYIY